MDLRRARSLTEHALQTSGRYGKPVCVAICDSMGFLLDFARMDGAPVRSIEISQAKAYTATRLGISTTAFHERLQSQGMPATYFGDPRLTGLPGGAIIQDAQGKTLAGIGISGLTPAQDQELADEIAGLKAET